MNHVHKITLRSHITALHSVLFFMVFAILSFGLLFYFNDDDTYFVERALGIICVLFFAPSLYLHFSYYLENKDFIMKGFDDTLEIKDTKRNKTWILNNENIISINVYAAPGLIKYGVAGQMLHLEYHYARIETNEGEFILTSLLYPYLMDIKFKFREIKVNYHETILATI